MVDKVKLTYISPGVLDIEVVTPEEFSVDKPIEENISLEEDLEVKRIISSDLEEVVENSLVEGTNNIFIKEKKIILPIENLEDSTYNIQ